jgi:hypothetical protein
MKPQNPTPKRIIGFKLPLDLISLIKAEADEAGCWPNKVVERIAREHFSKKREGHGAASSR